MDTLPELVNDYKGSGPARRRKREERWKLDGFLGSGGFGRVWRERRLEDGQSTRFRAVKTLPKQSQASGTIDYSRELQAMIKFSREKYTPSFVTMFGSIYIAMKYFVHGDLQQHLTHPLPETDARQITQQVLEGLEHLHENGFAHRDLKPANVFVVEKGPGWWVKIGDLGLSKRARDGETGFSSVAGTPGYQAPEIQSFGWAGQGTYTHLVDIWSLGVMTHYFLTRAFPFQTSHQWSVYRKNGAFPANALEASDVTSDGHNFITSLMTLEPNGRPSASHALQHAWLKVTLRDTLLSLQCRDGRDTVPEIEGVARLALTSSGGASRSWSEFIETFNTPP
ncbi:kinase-like domain-containing protein [Aspergillus keveii]|uniref:Serine/threonine-protein kinase ATG1 n=1 Tax=Aspergillus keveii TaxID=714993 RepID=A0ABR4GK99_9EURO